MSPDKMAFAECFPIKSAAWRSSLSLEPCTGRRFVLLCLLALGACNIEPFHLEFGSDLDGGSRVDGALRSDGKVQPDVSPFDPDAREGGGCVPQAEQ